MFRLFFFRADMYPGGFQRPQSGDDIVQPGAGVIAGDTDADDGVIGVLLRLFPDGFPLFRRGAVDAAKHCLKPGGVGVWQIFRGGAGSEGRPQHDLHYTFRVRLRPCHGGEGGPDHGGGHLGIEGEHRFGDFHLPRFRDRLPLGTLGELGIGMGLEYLLHPAHRPLGRSKQIPHPAGLAPGLPHHRPTGRERGDVSEDVPERFGLVWPLNRHFSPDELFSSHLCPSAISRCDR